MICVLEIFREHDVAMVEEGGQLPHGEIPHPPGVLVLVGEAGVQNQAPEGRGRLVHRTEWFDEEGEGAPARDDLDNALPDPRGKLGPERDLGGLVPLPAGMVGEARGGHGETGLGHDEPAFHDGASHGVEGAEAAVPLRGRPVHREHVPGRGLFEANEVREEP